MVPHQSTYSTWQQHANRRETLSYALLATLGLLLFSGAAIAFQFAHPGARHIVLGAVDDFSLDTPHLVNTFAGAVWIVRLAPQGDTQFVVLSSRTDNGTLCLVTWEATEGRFADPCIGTHFSKTGIYTDGPPPRHSMGQYAWHITDQGNLSVHLDQFTPGLTLEEIRTTCFHQLQQQGPAFVTPETVGRYLHLCDFEQLGREFLSYP